MRWVAEKNQTKRAERERQLLEELKEAAARLGIRVREERLLREVGYRVRSGACRVRDTDMVLLDRGVPLSVQIDILADVLAARSVEEVYLSPAARQLIDGRGGPSGAVQ
jgi:hypothetical protein